MYTCSQEYTSDILHSRNLSFLHNHLTIAKLSSYWNLFATDIFDFSSFSLLLLSQCHIVTIVTTIVGILNFYCYFDESIYI